jgi:hypothetical protein
MVPPPWKTAAVLAAVVAVVVVGAAVAEASPAPARRILLDADMDKDDFFALFYILKQNRAEFELKVVSILLHALRFSRIEPVKLYH